MRHRTARLVAWSLVALYFVLASAGVTQLMVSLRTHGSLDLPSTIGLTLLMVVNAVAGGIICSRVPANPIGWIAVLGPLTWGLDLFSAGYLDYGLALGRESWPGWQIALLWHSSDASRWALAGIAFVFMTYPDGRFLSSGWRSVAWVALASAAAHIILTAMKPGPIDGFPSLQNPYGVGQGTWRLIELVIRFADVLTVLSLAAAALSLFLRFLRSRGDVRQQIKWLVFPASFFPVALILLEFGGPELRLMGTLFQLLTFAALPIALAIAILKYRLYDIDIIIRKTLVYGLLTAVLAVIYFLGVAALQGLVTAVTGQQSPLVIVVSTLGTAALFTRLRNRIQAFIDRSFYRQKYDAEQTLARFARSARKEMDLDALTAELLKVIDETVRPEHVSISMMRHEV